jgi:hypothetical protein
MLSLNLPLALLHYLTIPARQTATLGGNTVLQNSHQFWAVQIPDRIQHLGVRHHRLPLSLPVFEHVGLQDGNLASVPSHDEQLGLTTSAQLPADPPTAHPRKILPGIASRSPRFPEGWINATGMRSAGIILDSIERIGITVRIERATHRDQ